MRSLVCAQCHVEYYFKGDGKYLTFPWDKGFSVEDMEAYYDEADFADYTHALSKARILKAQHPDYEISQMGIHAQRGVSCADCHMPYKSEGGMKFSDHHIQSPLAMIDRTCQVCHRESEETLRNNVYDRQRKANEIRGRLEHELAKAHIEAKFAWDKGATDAQMAEALKLIRQAQWRWDFRSKLRMEAHSMLRKRYNVFWGMGLTRLCRPGWLFRKYWLSTATRLTFRCLIFRQRKKHRNTSVWIWRRSVRRKTNS